MLTPVSTTIPPLQMIGFGKYQQSLGIDIIILWGKGSNLLLFFFHGVAQSHLLYLNNLGCIFWIRLQMYEKHRNHSFK
jgi:hypothetical protein